jgi:hypothetical protein
MTRWLMVSVISAGVALAAPVEGGAQQLRALTGRQDPQELPREYRPPRGMCRIWIDGVPADKQPAPTDCATAVKNKPRNGRVIFGEEARPRDDEKEKEKEKPKKPPR